MDSPSVLTLLLIGLNVAVSFAGFRAQGTPRRDDFVFRPSEVAHGRGLKGLALSHFSHADGGHLFLNMFGLYLFAPVVEETLGAGQLLIIYVASGLVATGATFLLRFRDPRFRALGASGSIAGVLFAAIVVRPEMNLYLLFIPIPVPAPLFAVGYVILSTYFMGRQGSRICHEAHVGGAVAGALLAGMLSPLGWAPLVNRISQLIG